MIQRVFNVRPGYDCRVECKHDPKGEHGLHCDEWVYTVVDRDARAALELEVYTPFYPPTVDKRGMLEVRQPFMGSVLHSHYGLPTTKEQVQAAEPHSTNCAYIGTCWGSSFGMAADSMVAKYFENNCEGGWPNGPGDQRDIQPRLWAALELRLVELIGFAERQRWEDGDRKWIRCECCKGEGVKAL